MIVMDSEASTKALLNSSRPIRLAAFGPLPAFTLSVREKESAESAREIRDRNSVSKTVAAKKLAAESTPQMTAISLLRVRLRTSLTPGFHARTMTQRQAEDAVLEAMGGISAGVLAVQLFADTSGTVSLNGPCNIWVGDILGSDTKLALSLERRLLEGNGALVRDKLASISIKERPQREQIQDLHEEPLNVRQTVSVMIRSLNHTNPKAFLLHPRLADGNSLPWEEANDDANSIAISALGALLPATAYFHDVRELFPPSEKQPSLQTLCKAIRELCESGIIEIYDQSLSGQEVLVIRHSLHDSWNAAAANMAVDSA